MTLLLAAGAPVELGRDEARRLAREELAKREYHRDDPGLVERAIDWILRRLGDVLDGLGGTGGVRWWLVVGVVVLLAVAILLVVRRRLGPLARSGAAEAPLFEGAERSAEEHRQRAEQHARAGEWELAARERLRAILRELEQRGLLERRPGRTVGEAAAEGGVVLPDAREDLTRAARAFDDVWYGGRRANAETDALLRGVDDGVRRARPPVRR